MEVYAKNDKEIVQEEAIKIALFLEEHRCSDTVVLDVRETCGWTNYFVIATVRSQAHSRGLFNNLEQFLRGISVEALHGKKGRHEKGWVLIDCGDIVLHLMEKEQREFYELERLWFRSSVIFQSSRSS
jgi:ribosome-associated protein